MLLVRGKELVPYINPNLRPAILKWRRRAIRGEDEGILAILIELRRYSELLKVEKKYPVITRIVKSSVYPEFLQEIYRRRKKKARN